MNQSRKFRRLILTLCAASLVLGGCRGGMNGNSVITLDPAPAVDPAQPDTAREAGYYGPETAQGAQPSAPAPAQPSLDQLRAAAEQLPETDSAYEPASMYTSIARGDVNIGLVVDGEMVINPLRCPYLDMMNLNTLVYEGLVELDATMRPQPLLADRWETDGSTWTFTLRNDVVFQNGRILAPEDIIASWEEIKRNPSSYWYPLISLIEAMASPDERTLTVKGHLGYMMLYAMTFPVVQRDTIEDARPVGTGPYLITQYETSTAVRLEANPQWWKKSAGQIHSIVGVCYHSQKSAVSALERGEIDTLASEYPTAAVNRNLSDRISQDYSTLTYECLVPNLKSGLTSAFPVRQALMYAIDRSTLANTVYTGMVKESEVPVVPGSWLYEPQTAQYNYGPERALQILYDAGWGFRDGETVLSQEINGVIVPLRLRLVTYDRGTTSTRTEAIAAIAAQLARVGIEVVTGTEPAGNARDRMSDGDFDLTLCAFELSEIPNLAFLLASNGGGNYAGYNSAEMDQMLRVAYEARSAEALRESLSDIQMKIVSDLPVLGLFFRSGVLSSSIPMHGLAHGLRRGYVLSGIANATLE